jgi:proline dehydrogenase
LKLAIITTIAAGAVIFGISIMMNTYAQGVPEQLLSTLSYSEITKDVVKDQVSQIMDNKSEEDHRKSLENASKNCDEKEENIELTMCISKEGNKINNDPLGLFGDISNKTL